MSKLFAHVVDTWAPLQGLGCPCVGEGGSFPKSLSRAFQSYCITWTRSLRSGILPPYTLSPWSVEMFIDLSVQIQLLIIITAWRQRAPLLSKLNPHGPVLCVRTPGLMDVSLHCLSGAGARGRAGG